MSDAFLAQAALAAALAWGAGLRLYAVVFVLGLLGRSGGFDLPESLAMLSHPLVLAGSGVLALAEFVGDKIPFVDSLSDTVQTFIRIPAGAALAAAVFGDSSGAMQTLAALAGGSFAATSHVAKAGTRALINTSPEPVSNWTASVAEDTAVLGGLALVFAYPWVALGIVAVLTVLFATVLWWVWRRLFRRSPRSAPG